MPVTRKTEILKRIETSALPAEVKEYFTQVMGGRTASNLKNILRKTGGAVVEDIDTLLSAGSAVLDLSKSAVLFYTGFDKNNMAPERFDAALAEVRAAVFLAAEGFTGLRQIERGRGRTADLRGEKAGHKYVFEVCCVRTGENPRPQMGRLESKCDKKVRQLKSSRKEYVCGRGGLIFVLEPYDFSAAPVKAGFNELVSGLYANKKMPEFTHLCVLSGINGCVFPNWTSEA